ncbi:hypothetical protein NL676_021494 [Syzygium grande]|nr:hypothetical protein NL676_021494 [Syzygium grande]
MHNNSTCLSTPDMLQSIDYRTFFSCWCIWVNGPVIVGAGPSGLAVGLGLKQQGVPFIILERANCIASLWQNRTYDRLKLHLPKQFCQLPNFPFPEDFPEYPTKNQFIAYLEYRHFEISPNFNETVQSAKYDETFGLWRVRRVLVGGPRPSQIEVEYICQWLVVASGENAEKIVPEFEGLESFGGDVMHACDYKSGENFRGKQVLVVGCGNSGMEVSLDLRNHNARPSMVVRSSGSAREINLCTGGLHDEVVATLFIDKILIFLAWLILGNVEKYGLKRPKIGPLQLKNAAGKTPVLDIGALSKIRSGEIKVVPGIKKFLSGQVELLDREVLDIDSVVLATGYCSNVPSWLKLVSSVLLLSCRSNLWNENLLIKVFPLDVLHLEFAYC